MKNYPDITDLLKAKAKRRKQLSQLSFEEKIAIVEKWRQLEKRIREYRSSIRQHSVDQASESKRN
jgi:hypothetical protein